MLRNYIKIAVRHLRKHKLLSAVTLLCLVAGITFSMLIGVYVFQQYSVNRQLTNVDQQYLVKSEWKVKDMGLEITTVAPLAKAAKEAYPQLIKNYYRFNPVTNVVSAGDKNFQENIAIGDTTIVNMYGFELLHGNKEKAFANNKSAVITKALALKLFNRTDVLGETIAISNTTSQKQGYIVSAVLNDMPFNTVNNLVDEKGYSVFVSFEGNGFFESQDYMNDWNNIYLVGMLELQPGKTAADMQEPFRQLLAKHATASIKDNLTVTLAPLSNYHLEANDGAVSKMLRTLGIIAAFILLMAIINFININIGTSSYRLKEIGLRKVFGSQRRQLCFQFVAESVIISFIAAFISVAGYQLLLPLFNTVLNASLTPVWQFSPVMFMALVGLVLVTGIIAGLYPALVLSTKNLTHAVKGKIDASKGGAIFRKSLLVTQFSLAIIVFIGAIIVAQQISYVFKKDLGYNKEHLMVVSAFPKQWNPEGVKKMETIRDGIRQLSMVKDAAISFEVPDRVPPNTIGLIPEGGNAQTPILAASSAVDEHFAATYQLQVKEGVFFDQAGTKDREMVINEAAQKALGLEEPLGKRVTIAGWGDSAFTIAGVIKNYNYSTMQQGIGPMVFMHTKDNTTYRYLTVKLQTADIAAGIAAVQKQWASLSPNTPFEYTFMDQRFKNIYQAELQLQKASTIATALNLVIVLLGIFGVLSFTLARRLKEISLRKIVGANTSNIIFLFIKEYAWLIVIANMIAWPVAYFASNKWLEQYAYRIEQNILPYLLVGLVVTLLAIVLITIQCFKIANANPVKSLRTE
jgi:putative ABC transport system permease protein